MSIKKGILHRPCPMCPYKHRSQFVISCLRVSSITHLFPAVRLQAARVPGLSCLGLGAAPNSCIPFKHDDTLAIIPPSRMESYHEIECNNELPSGSPPDMSAMFDNVWNGEHTRRFHTWKSFMKPETTYLKQAPALCCCGHPRRNYNTCLPIGSS